LFNQFTTVLERFNNREIGVLFGPHPEVVRPHRLVSTRSATGSKRRLFWVEFAEFGSDFCEALGQSIQYGRSATSVIGPRAPKHLPDMTMVCVAVTQNDLQRQYHLARQALSRLHFMPELPIHQPPTPVTSPNIPAVLRSLAAARHLLEKFRRQLESEKARRKLARLTNRLAQIGAELDHLPTDLR
jgi:hypothetical protein